MKSAEEIKIDKTKEQEAKISAQQNNVSEVKHKQQRFTSNTDDDAVKTANKNHAFGGKVPAFLLIKGVLAEE